MYYLRTPLQNFSWKSLKFKIRHSKNFQCPLNKVSLHYQTVIDQRLTVFSNCSVGLQLDPGNVRTTKWSVCKTIWESEQFPACNTTSSRDSFKANSFEMNKYLNQPLRKISNNFDKISLVLQFPGFNITSSRGSYKANSFEMNEYPNQPLKKLAIISIKLAYFFKLFWSQTLEPFCKLFRWTSVGLSKCPINKMIGLQDHLTVWAIPWRPHVLAETFLTKVFLQVNKF